MYFFEIAKKSIYIWLTEGLFLVFLMVVSLCLGCEYQGTTFVISFVGFEITPFDVVMNVT